MLVDRSSVPTVHLCRPFVRVDRSSVWTVRLCRPFVCVDRSSVDFFVALAKADQDTKLGFEHKEVVNSNTTSFRALKIED